MTNARNELHAIAQELEQAMFPFGESHASSADLSKWADRIRAACTPPVDDASTAIEAIKDIAVKVARTIFKNGDSNSVPATRIAFLGGAKGIEQRTGYGYVEESFARDLAYAMRTHGGSAERIEALAKQGGVTGEFRFPANTVGRFREGLLGLPDDMPMYTVYFVDLKCDETGGRVSKIINPMLSRETVNVERRRLGKFKKEGPHSIVIWANQDERAPEQRGERITQELLISDEQLWCVHVLGPDDVIAKSSKQAAMDEANALNVMLSKNERRSVDPVVIAIAVEWPYSAEEHAKQLMQVKA